MRSQPRTTGLLLCLSLASVLPSAFADNGDIVLTRDVQPRVATRPPLVPDPNPTTINVSPHQQVNQQTQDIDQLPGELTDSDFANINSGLSQPNRLLGADNPQALPGGQQHQFSGAGPSHGAGNASSGIGSQINSTMQRGLAPLQNLGAADMRALSCALLVLLAGYGHAAEPSVDRALIQHSGQGYEGNLMVNQAAGDWQQQSNNRAIATGHQASTSVNVAQRLDSLPPTGAGYDSQARIEGASFSRGSGVLGINQGAGLGNQQINAVRLQQGVAAESLDDSDLAQTSTLSPLSGTAESLTGDRTVATDDRAFAGSRGVVQLNQSAGVGNQSANSLSIRVVELP